MVLTRLRAGPGRSVAKRVCGVVLDHFDAQYFRELGAAWAAARDVLTSPSCWQYAVLLNRFNYPFDLEEDLHLKGYRTILQGSLPHCAESLKCYLSSTPGRMPSERHQVGNLKKYYLLNAASLLPVLALEPRDGEKVLDLCAAPGGKSIALLQCAYPGYLHCNEYDGLRLRWLRQTLESFIPQPLVNVIKVSELDGREVGDAQPETFDKVLVDAPCSNDRSWLFSSESQKAACRISQRRNLPVVQIELLRWIGVSKTVFSNDRISMQEIVTKTYPNGDENISFFNDPGIMLHLWWLEDCIAWSGNAEVVSLVLGKPTFPSCFQPVSQMALGAWFSVLLKDGSSVKCTEENDKMNS